MRTRKAIHLLSDHWDWNVGEPGNRDSLESVITKQNEESRKFALSLKNYQLIIFHFIITEMYSRIDAR